VNVIFAAHRLPPEQVAALPAERIVVNLEQVCAGDAWSNISPAYRRLLQTSTIVDYSERNREWLRHALGVQAELLTLGHAPELERIPRATDQDIDVLFYGKVTPRREAILRALAHDGLRLAVIAGTPLLFGDYRDQAIARSRVVLNLHAYDTHIFEQVRVNYLLINGKAVVSEVASDTEIPDVYRALVEPAPDARSIVERCRELAHDGVRRREREDAAREGMRALPQSALLERMACLAPAFGRAVTAS
jgi:hypothetical protein